MRIIMTCPKMPTSETTPKMSQKKTSEGTQTTSLLHTISAYISWKKWCPSKPKRTPGPVNDRCGNLRPQFPLGSSGQFSGRFSAGTVASQRLGKAHKLQRLGWPLATCVCPAMMDRHILNNQICSGKFVVVIGVNIPLSWIWRFFWELFLTYLRQDHESCQLPPILGPSASDGNNHSNQSHPNALAAYFATPGFAWCFFLGRLEAINF